MSAALVQIRGLKKSFGTTRVLDGTTPQEVTWRASESTEGSWQVRLVVACAGAECLPLPNPVRTERAVR